MTEKRNTDWTDKLRERLSDSELSPSADVWSKVESAVYPSRKAVPAAAWWGFAFAAAAAAAVLFIPKGGKLVEVAPEPQQTMLAEGMIADEDVVTDTVEPETVAPSTTAVAEKPADPAVADITAATTVPEDPAEPAAAAAPATPFAAECSTASAVADSPMVGNEPAAEYSFGTFPEEIVKHRKKAGVSLFASGIPGNSGLNSRPDIYIVQPGTSTTGTMGVGLPSITNAIDNAVIVVVDDNNGTFANNAGPEILGVAGKTNEGTEYYRIPGHEVRHHRPVSVGVTITYPLVRNLFLESGLSYTFLRSEFAGNLGDQRLHFLGVPLKLGYRFNAPSDFSVALSAGAMAEKCIYSEIFSRRVTIKDPQFSAVATASVNYNLGQHLSLFIAPELNYYFTGTAVQTYRTERPLSMTLRLGVNLDLGKQ